MNGPSASIIIPVYNRTEDLAHVLRQLDKQSLRDFEVVVVDDGSHPAVAGSISPEELSYPLRIVRHEQRGGVGRARNTGVRAAQSTLLLFVDSDGDIPDEAWFEKHLMLRRHAGDLARQAGKNRYVLHSTVLGLSHTYWGRTDTYSNWFGSSMSSACEVRDRHVPTHNTSFDKDVFAFVGPFDESLEVCEDVEWALRCLDKGVGLFYVPGAPVGHFDRNTLRDVWRHYHQFGRYALQVRRRRCHSAYEWLYPKSALSAILLFFPLTGLMTAYVAGCWLRHDPWVLLYLPGLYFANVAYYAGICQSFSPDKDE